MRGDTWEITRGSTLAEIVSPRALRASCRGNVASIQPNLVSGLFIDTSFVTGRSPVGQKERFIQTSLREWAYACAYNSPDERASELPHWQYRSKAAHQPSLPCRGRPLKLHGEPDSATPYSANGVGSSKNPPRLRAAPPPAPSGSCICAKRHSAGDILTAQALRDATLGHPPVDAVERDVAG